MADARAIAEFAPDVCALSDQSSPIVSAYLAIGSELDPAFLSLELRRRGAIIALPVIIAKAAPLEFRAWQPGDLLREREWGIREPGPACLVVSPDIVLVPLLSIDSAGNRLGYGGGYYDRTLGGHKGMRPWITIGVAYASQVIDAVPIDAYDMALDFLLTPKGLSALH